MNFVIRNAALYDGTGAEAQPGMDVLVKNGKIARVGTALAADGADEVDAKGLALMPGIIDTHTHFDAQITWDSGVSPSPALGVTTVVMGNCGFTIAPCKERDRDLVMKNLTQVEGMSLDALREGIDWNFETFPEYVAMLSKKGVVPNVACFLGHSSIRTYVMGAAATERAATPDEISQMCAIVEQGMAAGAIGFATSTAPQHNGWAGVPMPSRLADDDELLALVQAMAKSGRGIFMLTKGNRTDVAYLEKLAEKTGRPIMIAALLHNSTKPTGTLDELARIAEARGARTGTLGAGLVLPADHGLHDEVRISAGRLRRLAAADEALHSRPQGQTYRSGFPSGGQGRAGRPGRRAPVQRRMEQDRNHRGCNRGLSGLRASLDG